MATNLQIDDNLILQKTILQQPSFSIIADQGEYKVQTLNFCKRLQGAADARRRARGRTFVLQVPDNKADAAPCECLQKLFSTRLKKGSLKNNVTFWQPIHPVRPLCENSEYPVLCTLRFTCL